MWTCPNCRRSFRNENQHHFCGKAPQTIDEYILWFCHDPRFVFKGTEDMVSDYHDYWFHIKGFFIGEALALVICAAVGLVVQYVL